MKRLFVVINTHTGEQYGDGFFRDKITAKECRDALNGQSGKVAWKVSRGPDHWKESQ